MANKYQLADSATEALKEKLIHTNHVHLFGETVVVVFAEEVKA